MPGTAFKHKDSSEVVSLLKEVEGRQRNGKVVLPRNSNRAPFFQLVKLHHRGPENEAPTETRRQRH